LVPLHVGEEVVNPGVVEDQTDSGGSGGDAENRGDGDDAPVPDPAPSLAALPIYLPVMEQMEITRISVSIPDALQTRMAATAPSALNAFSAGLPWTP